MDGALRELRFVDKQKLVRRLRCCRDGGLNTHYVVIVNLVKRPPTPAAAALHIACGTGYPVTERLRQSGEWGLLYRREDNGESKLSERVLAAFHGIARDAP
jgi:hypothetical protein